MAKRHASQYDCYLYLKDLLPVLGGAYCDTPEELVQRGKHLLRELQRDIDAGKIRLPREFSAGSMANGRDRVRPPE